MRWDHPPRSEDGHTHRHREQRTDQGGADYQAVHTGIDGSSGSLLSMIHPMFPLSVAQLQSTGTHCRISVPFLDPQGEGPVTW
jgi:hypothetical protein